MSRVHPNLPGTCRSRIHSWKHAEYEKLPCNHKGLNKPHGLALELVHRAENRCESSGAPAGAFPRTPPGPGWAGKRPKIVDFWSYPSPLRKNLKTLLTALEEVMHQKYTDTGSTAVGSFWGVTNPRLGETRLKAHIPAYACPRMTSSADSISSV